jgi:ribosome biogenesis GTPase
MRLRGQVVSLDRIYPLVRTDHGDLRSQHAVSLAKSTEMRAAIGDRVIMEDSDAQDMPQIIEIEPRGNTLVRRECSINYGGATERIDEQVLATNFDRVLVVVALSSKPLNLDHLLRQLVVAYDSGGSVTLILNKIDQAKDLQRDLELLKRFVPGVDHLAISAWTGEGIDQLRSLFESGKTTVLFGRSGVGKSTIINVLMNQEVQKTAATRAKDQGGRHTTTARTLLFTESGAGIIDMPGLRTVGVYGADEGLELVFSDIMELAKRCRFRDCSHRDEPSCAVEAAVQEEDLESKRLEIFRVLESEVSG